MTKELPHPADVIPHSGPAVLIDEVQSHSSEETSCRAVVSDGMQYVVEGRVDAAVALELMAQTIAVHVGLEGRWNGDRPRAGYVIGVPKMTFIGGDYVVGDCLEIIARVVFHEGPVGRFDAEVVQEGEIRAHGSLTVFEPPLAGTPWGGEERSGG